MEGGGCQCFDMCDTIIMLRIINLSTTTFTMHTQFYVLHVDTCTHVYASSLYNIVQITSHTKVKCLHS